MGMSGHPILIKSTDKVNFATHDNNLTTNREEKEEDGIANANNNLRSTASGGTLSQLLHSLKQTRMDPNIAHMPSKQSKKYHIDLGQNVSADQTLHF